jgi:hypothetical protein
MLDTLITNKTRIKLLLRFFLNSSAQSYLRNLESEFDVSTNAVRLELNRFEKAGLLISTTKGNRKMYQANTNHPLFPDIHNILMKYVGFDQILDKVIAKLGGVNKVYLTGELAHGHEINTIELIMIGDNIDESYLSSLAEKTSSLINRRIKYLVLRNNNEEKMLKSIPDAFLIWKTGVE